MSTFIGQIGMILIQLQLAFDSNLEVSMAILKAVYLIINGY